MSILHPVKDIDDNIDRVAIFVDVQNIYYTVMEAYNAHFNYSYFFSKVTEGREVFKALAYATERNDKSQLHFQNILRQIGFEVLLIPYIQRSDGSAKGNWDIGISLDMLEYAKEVDVLVLVTGDGDYAPVIEKAVSMYPLKVEVYGVQKLTALSLIKVASRFISIDESYIFPIPARW